MSGTDNVRRNYLSTKIKTNHMKYSDPTYKASWEINNDILNLKKKLFFPFLT